MAKELNTKKLEYFLAKTLAKVNFIGYSFFHLAKVLATTNSEPELALPSNVISINSDQDLSMTAMRVVSNNICLDALCPSQEFFSHVTTISCLPGFNQYLEANKVPCSKTLHSDSCES